MPTEAARRGDLSAYGVRIFDPATGAEFPNGVIPTSRLSPQVQNLLALMPAPNAPGTENGTRNNYVASGTEKFEEDSFNVGWTAGCRDAINNFARFSFGDFFRDGPTAFGAAGGREIVSLGGVSQSQNMSLAYGLDYALSSNWLVDFRFGWFRYRVDVLPFDYGTQPALEAGIPGLNLDETFTSGLPLFRIEGDRGFGMGSGLDDTLGNRCNCPLAQNEKQWQAVGNVTRLVGNHSFKFGIDIRRAYNLRVPSDRHRSGELTFNVTRTADPTLGGGLGLATFLLGDVTRFTRYVSPTTDARERQWRHFYYAQDTWRVNQKLTLNAGVRLDVINPQTVNEPGNGGWLDLTTGRMLVGGVGGIDLAGNVENRLNWAPRVGATYKVTESTVLRAGFGRSYDIGVFGSLFGHTVTQNLPVLSAQELNAPSNFAAVFNLGQGPPSPTFVQPDQDGTFPLPNGVFSRAPSRKQRPPEVDAWNVTVQHQLGPTMSVEAGYIGNKGRHVFVGDGPDVNFNAATIEGFPGVPRDQRRPFFSGAVVPPNTGLSGAYGWTQDIAAYYNPGQNWYNALQLRFNRRFSDGYAIQTNYTLQKAEQESTEGSYWIWDRELAKGPADWDRTHNFNLTLLYQMPFGRDQRWGSDWSGAVDAVLGGWQFNTNLTIQSGRPFNVNYANSGLDRDTGPNWPNLIGDGDGEKTQQQWFNGTPIGSQGSAFERPAPGTFGNLGRNALRGPGYWRADASLFKSLTFGERRLELRLEAVNLFNNVNLENPDTEVGVPGNPRPNAGRITSTAYGGQDLQRNLQFGVKFVF